MRLLGFPLDERVLVLVEAIEIAGRATAACGGQRADGQMSEAARAKVCGVQASAEESPECSHERE